MPVVARCPNCHAPVDRVPDGGSGKCPYCDATLLATRYMPAPVLPPQPPQPPPPQPPPQFPPPPVVPQRHGKHAALASVLSVLLLSGGSGLAIYLSQREARQAAERVRESIAAAFEPSPAGGVTSREEDGWVVVSLPAATGAAGPRVTAELPTGQVAGGMLEVSIVGDRPFVMCAAKLVTLDGKPLGGADDEAALVQFMAAVPPDRLNLVLDCASHPVERTVRVWSREPPVLAPGSPARLTMPAGTKSATALAPVETPGPHVVHVECDDVLTGLSVVGPDGRVVAETRVGAGGVADVEADLAAGNNTVRLVRPIAAGEPIEATVTLAGVASSRISIGDREVGTLSRTAPRARFAFDVEEPRRVEAVASSQVAALSVEIRGADGVPVAAGRSPSSGREAKASPPEPLGPGAYLIVVGCEGCDRPKTPFMLRLRAAGESAGSGGSQPAGARRRPR